MLNYQRRNLVIGATHEAVWGVSFALLDPYTILQLALKDLGGDPSLAGLLGGLLLAGLCLLQLPAAFLIPSRFTDPAKTALLHLPALACTGGLALLFYLPGLSPAAILPWYLGLAAAFFLFIGVAVPFWMGMITRCVAPQHRGRYFAWCFALANLGGIASGAVAVRWIRDGGLAWGYGQTFAAALVLQLISVGLLVFLRPLQGPSAPVPPWGQFWRKQWQVLSTHGAFRRFLVLIAIMNIAAAPFYLFTDYLKERGLATDWWGALNAAKNTGGILGSFALGYIADKRGPRLGLGLGFAFMAAALLLIPMSSPVASLGAFLGGGYFVTPFMVINLYILTLIGGKDHTTALAGTMALVSTPVVLLSPWLSGVIAERWGHPLAFGLSGVLCALGAAFVWRSKVFDSHLRSA